jgi:hypothetical protein
MLAANADYVRNYPVATKRVVRAILNADDICAAEPERVARRLVTDGYTTNYDQTLQSLIDLPFRAWRDYDPEDAIVRAFGLLRQDLLDPQDRLVDRPLGADAFGDDAVHRIAPDVSLPDLARAPFIVPHPGVVQLLPAGQRLDRRPHPVRIVRIQPERLVDELAHWRQEAIAGECQPVREPAALGEEADEVAGECRIAAGLVGGAADIDSPTPQTSLRPNASRSAGCTRSHQNAQKASQPLGISAAVNPACSKRLFQTWTWLEYRPIGKP